jgi:hypothetical protein
VATITVTVVSVTLEADLRKIHAYRKRWTRKLKGRQAVLLVNRAKDRARLVDSVGACHNYYAPEGQQFDTREIERQVAVLGLVLTIGGQAAREIDGAKEERRAA